MRAALLAALLAVTACASAGASPAELRARVSPKPTALSSSIWPPTIQLTDRGRPAAARLALTIRKGSTRRSFRPRAQQRGSYRAQVRFPSDGRWTWTLTGRSRVLARGAISVSTRVTFSLPYDLSLEPDGTVLFLDRSRVLALHSGRVRVHARTPSQELTGMHRLADGTLFVTDFPGNRILRIATSGRVTPVARIEAPANLVADETGTTLWVASIAAGVGVFRVDVASGRVEPFSDPDNPHGIDRAPNGDFFVQDGNGVSRMDGVTGALIPFANVGATNLHVAADGSVYGVEGRPSGGRVVRIAPDGAVTTVAGTGMLGPHRDGPALEIQVLPSAVLVAPDGAVLFTQVEPVAAVRRIDPANGRVTTLARGR
jgi:DNA-binding beta-propeller fold protein YncE